jgi:hypothetical protein
MRKTAHPELQGCGIANLPWKSPCHSCSFVLLVITISWHDKLTTRHPKIQRVRRNIHTTITNRGYIAPSPLSDLVIPFRDIVVNHKPFDMGGEPARTSCTNRGTHSVRLAVEVSHFPRAYCGDREFLHVFCCS